MADLIYDEARESDVEQIQQAAAESWHATYKDIYSPDYIVAFLARAYSTESLLRSIRHSRSTFLVARGANHIEGLCHFGHGRDGPELFRLYVVPSHWRMGVGSRLLQLMESRWIAQGVSEYFCYVHSRNEIGKAFYLKKGFVHDPSRDREDEWYMHRWIA